MYFLKKLYKYTYICIRDVTGLRLPCPENFQGENFPSQNASGWDGTGKNWTPLLLTTDVSVKSVNFCKISFVKNSIPTNANAFTDSLYLRMFGDKYRKFGKNDVSYFTLGEVDCRAWTNCPKTIKVDILCSSQRWAMSFSSMSFKIILMVQIYLNKI